MLNYAFNICLLGDSGVGKTSLCNLLVNDFFKSYSETTIGIDFGSKSFEIKHFNSRLNLKWLIWDTAGQEKFRCLLNSYVRHGTVYFILFDTKNRESFNNVNYWYKFIVENCSNDKFIYLIGNKIDKFNRQIEDKEAIEKAKQLNIKYVSMSIKENINLDFLVDMVNNDISKIIFDNEIDEEYKRNIFIKNLDKKIIDLKKENTEENKKNSCCS